MRLALLLVLFLAVALAVFMILRPSGPRVTHIEHRRDEDDDREGSE